MGVIRRADEPWAQNVRWVLNFIVYQPDSPLRSPSIARRFGATSAYSARRLLVNFRKENEDE